jgi:thiol-disulfide isomerase/thioredoxin
MSRIMLDRTLVAVLALAVAALPAAAGAASPPAPLAPLSGPKVGEPAPPFSLTTLDGRTVSLDSLRGKTVVINVWATWCPPCREETPDVLKAEQQLRGQGVVFLGVDTTEQAPIVRAFVAAKGVPYAQAIGDKAFEHAYGIEYFPTTFVIGPDGVLRARTIDTVTAAQLASAVASAKAGSNVVIASAIQTKIDETLADPSIRFDGDAASIAANAKKASEAIDKAEELAGQADPAKGDVSDFLRTQAEENALRDRAIAALAPVAASEPDRVLLGNLRGDAAIAESRWSDALDAYQTVLAIAPADMNALQGSARAASRLERSADAIAFDERIVKADPQSVDARITLALAYSHAQRYPQAYAAAEAGTALAERQAAAKPNDPSALKMLAWSHLYAGRIYAKGGEPAKAQAEFDATRAAALRLPPSNSRYAMYLEESQEATVALGLGNGPRKTTVSLAPWTGADLPGSVPSTIKYRLAVAGNAGASVNLSTEGLPKGWVASFCTDRLCAPFKVGITLPASGVKVIEFQLIPDSPGAAEPRVTVLANDGTSSSSASTLALR